MPWESQIPSLLSKRTDVVGTNIHVNPERVKVISFTGPAWWYGPVLLVQKGNPDGIKSYDDLKGKDVGAVAGSAAEAYLRTIGAKTVPFEAQNEELQSLNQGRVKYVLEDDVVFSDFASKANPTATIEALSPSPRRLKSSTAAATATPATPSARRTASSAPPIPRPSPSCAATAWSAPS